MALFLWAMLIVPWITLFWMDRDSIRRYMPVGIFTSLLMTILQEIAYTQKWWVLKNQLFPQTVTFVPFVYGLFIPLTMWIFYFTFRKFWLYFLTNLVLDAVFAFPVDTFFQRIDVYKLVHTTQLGRFVETFSLSLVIYVYQLWQQKAFYPTEKRTPDPHSDSMTNITPGLRRKAK